MSLANKSVSLPLSRIRMIMKSSPEVASISHESVFLISKATELFVQHLAVLALSHSDDTNQLNYSELVEVVKSCNTMEFLQGLLLEGAYNVERSMKLKNAKDIIPRKVKVKDCPKLKESDDDEF